MSDHPHLDKLIYELEVEYVQLLNESRKMRWFLALALTAWPLGFFVSPWLALFITFSFFTIWAVGSYVSFMHRRENQRKLEDAKKRKTVREK